MWFLTCDGDHLGGKRLWLRPGSLHLFGRTRRSNKDAFHAIANKSVSRQHFELLVDPVKPGDSANVYKRSTLTLKDLGSKLGTFVDDEKVKGASLVLSKASHVIRLGNYDVLFHIKWQPTVFTFTLGQLPRAARQAADPLAELRTKIESLDIKLVTEFLPQQTTHVISKKRNFPLCLQALVHARFIVIETYLDAVNEVAKQPEVPAGTADDSAPLTCRLEEEFDANWPSAINYLPPPGAEPHPRPENDPSYAPNAHRSEMFSKFVFIFTDSQQYQNLLPVIAGGSGKALLHELPGPENHPDFDEFLDYVKSCAGSKGDAAFGKHDSSIPNGGVIVVRPPEASKTGGVDFFQRLDLALDQRSVEQNEFLEAILEVDAASMRRALEVEMEDAPQPESHSAPSVAENSLPSSGPGTNSASATAPDSLATKRKARRNFTRQKITTFDDFDPSQIVKYSPPPEESAVSNDEQLGSIKESPNTQKASGPSQAASAQRTRKRAASSQLQPVESTEQVLDTLFTGAAALKKRRMEEASRGKSIFSSGTHDASPESDTTKPRKSRKEQDEALQRIMQERREEQDRLRQQDEENLRNAMEGMNVAEMRNLAKVETMELVRPREVNGKERWNPEWNGRPNWKRFRKRRSGQSNDAQGPGRRRVIVPLVAYDPMAARQEDYWLRNSSQHDDDDEIVEVPASLEQRVERSRREDRRDEEISELLPEEIGGTPRDPVLRERLQDAGGRSGLSGLGRSLFEKKSAQNSGIRAAGTTGRKRAREVSVRQDEDDDEDEDGGLKFRRRRRG